MIKLIGIISKGGIPIRVKALIDIEAEELLAGMIEAIRALSSVIGKKEIKMLDFGKDKLLFTESEKGYTIVALVDRAEEYVERFLEILADDIDSSSIEYASGLVSDEVRVAIDKVIDNYIKDTLDINIHDILKDVWQPILRKLMENNEILRVLDETERAIISENDVEEKWEKFKRKVKPSLDDAIRFALNGDFDHACAASIDLDDYLAKIFAVKMGLLAFQMTNSIVPPIEVLKKTLDSLDPTDPYVVLLRKEIGFLLGEVSSIEFLKCYEDTAKYFERVRDESQFLLAFLFIDSRLGYIPEFASKLADYFMAKSDVIHTYILAILDRNRIFSKIYSVTKYDDFKDDHSTWKMKIANILKEMDKFIKLGSLKKFFGMMPKGAEINKLGITYSLNLQTYIALLTALAESPILPLPERKKVLEEVLELYDKYVRDLIRSNISLFATTIINIFQSVGVALAEMYYMLSEKERKPHIARIKEFLGDIIDITFKELIKRKMDTQLNFVMMNSLFPILAKTNEISQEEVKLLYATIRTIKPNIIESTKKIRPYGFAVTVGNLLNTLASIIIRISLDDKQSVASKCFKNLVDINRWFLAQGVICRDDIVSLTYNLSRALDYLDSDIGSIIRFVFAQNKIVMIDPSKFDYEVAIVSENLIDFLLRAGRILNDESYIKYAKMIFEKAVAAWRKYGFEKRAQELIERYRNKYDFKITI